LDEIVNLSSLKNIRTDRPAPEIIQELNKLLGNFYKDMPIEIIDWADLESIRSEIMAMDKDSFSYIHRD
jgi:hypothetical protein